MKSRFRQSMNWLHTWVGFSFGWLVYFIFFTGTTGYFENEIDRWMKPEITITNSNMLEEERAHSQKFYSLENKNTATNSNTLVKNTEHNYRTNQNYILATAEQQLQNLAPDSSKWYIGLPASRTPYIEIIWFQLANGKIDIAPGWHEKNINFDTGSTVNIRETAGGETLYRMHYNLHYVPELVGYILTSLAAMFMLIALVTGIIIHKKIFLEFFTFRPKKGLRSWLDIHNIFSVLPLPFHLMITYSGLLLLMTVTMSKVVDVRYGEDKKSHKDFFKAAQSEIKQQQFIKLLPTNLSIKNVVNDARTRFNTQKISYVGVLNRGTEHEYYEVWFDKFEGVHLVSAIEYRVINEQVEISISTGKKHEAAKLYDLFEHLHEGLFANIYLRWLYFISGLFGAAMVATGMVLWIKKRNVQNSKSNGIRLISIIERVNIGIIIGVPIATAIYFWSNRLLPNPLNNRADWEVHSFFIALFTCVTFCLVSTKQKIWHNILWLAASVYALLPLINFLTTKHNIISSLQNNDWLMFGFDLSMLMFSLLFTLAAIANKKYGQK